MLIRSAPVLVFRFLSITQCINSSHPGCDSINELTEMFGETDVEYIPARDGEYDYTLADSSKAKELLGWNPTLDISDYISDVIDDKS